MAPRALPAHTAFKRRMPVAPASSRAIGFYRLGTVGVNCEHCVGPEVTGNVFAGLISNIRFNGDVSPRAVNNRSIGVNTQLATITLSPGTSWPFIDDNIITNGSMGASTGRDMGISVVGSQRVDYPLLGKRGAHDPQMDGRKWSLLSGLNSSMETQSR